MISTIKFFTTRVPYLLFPYLFSIIIKKKLNILYQRYMADT